MWNIIHYIVQCVEGDKEVKKARDLKQGKIVDQDDENQEKEASDEEGSPFEEFVLLKDFQKSTIKLYKKNEDEDDDEDEDEDDDK